MPAARLSRARAAATAAVGAGGGIECGRVFSRRRNKRVEGACVFFQPPLFPSLSPRHAPSSIRHALGARPAGPSPTGPLCCCKLASAARSRAASPRAAAAATKRARDLGEDAAPPRGAAELAAGQAAGRLPGSRGGGEPALEAADERRFVGVRVFGGGGAMGWVEEGDMGPRVETTRLGFRLARRARWPSTPVLSKGNRRARKKGPPCRTHPRWTSSHVPLQQQGATSLFAKEALTP